MRLKLHCSLLAVAALSFRHTCSAPVGSFSLVAKEPEEGLLGQSLQHEADSSSHAGSSSQSPVLKTVRLGSATRYQRRKEKKSVAKSLWLQKLKTQIVVREDGTQTTEWRIMCDKRNASIRERNKAKKEGTWVPNKGGRPPLPPAVDAQTAARRAQRRRWNQTYVDRVKTEHLVLTGGVQKEPFPAWESSREPSKSPSDANRALSSTYASPSSATRTGAQSKGTAEEAAAAPLAMKKPPHLFDLNEAPTEAEGL